MLSVSPKFHKTSLNIPMRNQKRNASRPARHNSNPLNPSNPKNAAKQQQEVFISRGLAKPKRVIKQPNNIDEIEALLSDESVMKRLPSDSQQKLIDYSQQFMTIHSANTFITMKMAPVIWQQFQLALVLNKTLPPPQTKEDILYPDDHVLEGLVNHGILRRINLNDPEDTITHPDQHILPGNFLGNPTVQRYQHALQNFFHNLQPLLPHSTVQNSSISYVPNIINPFAKTIPGETATDFSITVHFGTNANLNLINIDTELDEYAEVNNVFSLIDSAFGIAGGYSLKDHTYQNVYTMNPKQYAKYVQEIDSIRKLDLSEDALQHMQFTTITSHRSPHQNQVYNKIMEVSSPTMLIELLSMNQRDDISNAWSSPHDGAILDGIAIARDFEQEFKQTNSTSNLNDVLKHKIAEIISDEDFLAFKQLVAHCILQKDATEEYITSVGPTHFYSGVMDILAQRSSENAVIIEKFITDRQLAACDLKEERIADLDKHYSSDKDL